MVPLQPSREIKCRDLVEDVALRSARYFIENVRHQNLQPLANCRALLLAVG
jgi:hypothetical protein